MLNKLIMIIFLGSLITPNTSNGMLQALKARVNVGKILEYTGKTVALGAVCAAVYYGIKWYQDYQEELVKQQIIESGVPMVVLISSDGARFTVPRDVALESPTLASMYHTLEGEELPLVLSKPIMAFVAHYFWTSYLYDLQSSQDLFYVINRKASIDTMEIFKVANFLQSEQLLQFAAHKFALSLKMSFFPQKKCEAFYKELEHVFKSQESQKIINCIAREYIAL